MEGVSLVATSRRAFALVFLVHLGVQGLVLTRVPERWVRPHTRFEVTAVAMSLYERTWECPWAGRGRGCASRFPPRTSQTCPSSGVFRRSSQVARRRAGPPMGSV
jgi:hypothetical protein